MKIIKILGTGCANCVKLESNTKLALQKIGMEAEVQKVTDIAEIMSYGVMKTPGLVIDDEVVSSGRVNEVDEIIDFLEATPCSEIGDGCCEDGTCCQDSECGKDTDCCSDKQATASGSCCGNEGNCCENGEKKSKGENCCGTDTECCKDTDCCEDDDGCSKNNEACCKDNSCCSSQEEKTSCCAEIHSSCCKNTHSSCCSKIKSFLSGIFKKK